jgi:hypothetical protein
MAEYRDKLTKTAAPVLGGETFVAAIKCFPIGHTKRKMRNSLMGAAGALYTASGTKDGHAIGGEHLPLELAIGLTPTRVFVFGLSKMTGKATLPPRRVLERNEVAGISCEDGKTLHVKHTLLWVRLTDGSELGLETAQGHAADGADLVAQLRAAGVPAVEIPSDAQVADDATSP